MSMLAEKKSRKKWIPNPQGNFWSKDSNKFGQKLLEKMGWTPGQGLGVQNQGRSEVLRIQFKNNNTGLGFDENDSHKVKHQSTFNNFLSSLTEQGIQGDGSTSVEIETKPTSLEIKSRNSRNRIHYHKYTRGKDLTQYSEKDLAAILEISDVIANEISTVEEEINSKNEINGGSMEEYFRKKQLKIKGKDSIQNNFIINENGEHIDERADRDFLDVLNSQHNDKDLCDNNNEDKKCLQNQETSQNGVEDFSSEILNKKDNFRKKSTSKNFGEEFMIEDSQDVVPTYENTTKKKKIKFEKTNENATVSEGNIKKKKRSKEKSSEESILDNCNQRNEYPKEKKRKLQAEESNVTNSSEIVLCAPNSIKNDIYLNETKDKNSTLDFSNVNKMYSNEVIKNCAFHPKKKSKRKHKESSNTTSDMDIICEEHSDNILRETSPFSISNDIISNKKNQQKKKKSKKINKESILLTDVESISITERNTEVFPPDDQGLSVEHKANESKKVNKLSRKAKKEMKIVADAICVIPGDNNKSKKKTKLKVKEMFVENSEGRENYETVQEVLDDKNVIVQKEVIHIQNSEEKVSSQSGQNFESIKRHIPSSVKQYFKKYNLLVSKPELDFNGSNIYQIKGYGKLQT